MKTTVLLIRHGESTSNVTNSFAGHLDVALSERGRRQAELTGLYLKDTPIDAFYSSDLRRAYETALATAAHHGLPVIRDRQLREIHCGAWDGLSHRQIAERYPEVLHVWRTDIGMTQMPGGESVAQVQARVWPRLCAIAAAHPGQTVCIASHGMAIHCMIMKVLGWELARMKELPMAANASVTTLCWEDGKFSLVEYDHCGHLQELVTRFGEDGEKASDD